jgi:hypothetical protein
MRRTLLRTCAPSLSRSPRTLWVKPTIVAEQKRNCGISRIPKDSPLEGGGFEPSVPVKKKPIYVVPKRTLLRMATRIGDGDIGPSLKYDGSGLSMTFSSGSSCTNAVEIAGHYALAALGQRIGAVRGISLRSPFR